MKQRNWIPWLLVVLALTVPAAFAPRVTADWLVTHDGREMETRGPWQEKGRLVVFTAADGTLSSIRASEIDLEASRARTEEKLAVQEQPAPPPPVQKKAPILVLTDDDVGHINAVLPDGEDEEQDGQGSGNTQKLEVVNWRQADLPDGGVRIHGTVRNNGDQLAVGITVDVNLLDVQGAVLMTRPAELTARGLRPSEMANFQVDFPDVVLFDSASFKVNQVQARVEATEELQAPAETEAPLEPPS